MLQRHDTSLVRPRLWPQRSLTLAAAESATCGPETGRIMLCCAHQFVPISSRAFEVSFAGFHHSSPDPLIARNHPIRMRALQLNAQSNPKGSGHNCNRTQDSYVMDKIEVRHRPHLDFAARAACGKCLPMYTRPSIYLPIHLSS